MPTRNKRQAVEATITDARGSQPIEAAVETSPATGDEPQSEAIGIACARTFKPTLTVSAKGVMVGARDGHDWVVSFPADPGKEIKDRLLAAGFSYGDKKWRVFTNAANRAVVTGLVKELQQQLGEEISVNEYTARQVVLAFEASPGEEVIQQLREAGFHYRSDRTWNAEQSAQNQKFAKELIESLPDKARSAAAAR